MTTLSHPASCFTILWQSATKGTLTSLSGSPNRLLYSLFLWMGSINGVDYVFQEGNETYSMAGIIGGSGTYIYTWWYSTDGVSFSSVGSSSSYTRFISENDPGFYLKAEVSSAGGSFDRTLFVQTCWDPFLILC